MKYPIYSYRDRLVGFGQPVIDQNDASAIRGFAYAVGSSNGLMNFSPKDYELYKIGEFEVETGKIVPLELPELVITGINALEKE